MRTQLVLPLILGVLLSLQAGAQREHHQGERERGNRSMSPDVNRATPAYRNAAPIIRAPVYPSVFQASTPQHRPSVRTEGNKQTSQENRHRGDNHRGRGDHRDHRGSHGNGGTSVYLYPYAPYNPYPNYLAPFSRYPAAPVEPYNDYSSAPVQQYNAYPDRYFVCYQPYQVGGGLYRVSCPYPVSWYSTSPEYSSYEYQASYQPRYVCPNNGANGYVEFDTSDAAMGWANGFCNQVVNQQDLP